jgi:hypothetical protein
MTRPPRIEYKGDDEGQLVEAWYGASDPANSGAGNWRYDGFNYDALGNRAWANFLANPGAMTFTRKDNGLNQYRGWWNFSVTNYDDDVGGNLGFPAARQRSADARRERHGWVQRVEPADDDHILNFPLRSKTVADPFSPHVRFTQPFIRD